MAHSAVLKKAKEVYKCLHSLESFTNGRAKVISWDQDTLSEMVVELYPEEGPFRGGAFPFKLCLLDYPELAPCVTSLSPGLLHPNITPKSGDVCFNLLEDETWNCETMGLDTIITGLLFLLYNPNFDDPLWSPDGGWTEEQRALFAENVAKAMKGENNVYEYDFARSCVENADQPLAGQPCVADCSGRGPVPQMELVSKVTSGFVNMLVDMEDECEAYHQKSKPPLRQVQTLLPSQNIPQGWNPIALHQFAETVQQLPSCDSQSHSCHLPTLPQHGLTAAAVNLMPTFGTFESRQSDNKMASLRRTHTWHPVYNSC